MELYAVAARVKEGCFEKILKQLVKYMYEHGVRNEFSLIEKRKEERSAISLFAHSRRHCLRFLFLVQLWRK